MSTATAITEISRTKEIVPMQKYIKGYVHRKRLTQYLMFHELYRD